MSGWHVHAVVDMGVGRGLVHCAYTPQNDGIPAESGFIFQAEVTCFVLWHSAGAICICTPGGSFVLFPGDLVMSGFTLPLVGKYLVLGLKD